ncbi:MAG TPA: HisA/HisF-related TIM barrel protein [Caldilineaceae bacterium]|nr:NUDIX domain-containing protein [Caldilineaceae bacterium]HRW04744.1 HisA/HisF-related TIM barrel protein [Caldilineaceae bacterium]
MIIFPAIELREGRCVQLRQGNPNAETVVCDNPVELALRWVEQGAEWLHIVNLDGAWGTTKAHLNALYRPANIWVKHPDSKEPEPPEVDLMRRLPENLRQLRAIRKAVPIPIQFGGGLRTLDDIRLALELGVNRVILGTIAVEQPELVRAAVEQWGAERIAVGIDVRDGKVATHGWRRVSEIDPIDLGHRAYAMGIRRVVYTDINRDGTLSGVNINEAAQLGDLTSLRVIAGGGVADLYDVNRLKAREHFNIEGAIVGRALSESTLDLREAIAVGHQRLKRSSAGIIPFRQQNEQVEFLLLFNLFFEQWQFPRGSVDGEECNQACAMREFEEETGLVVTKMHDDCRSVLEYTTMIRDYEIERKIVYYLAEVTSNEVRLGHENHCEARWMNAEEAWELLTETAPEQLPALDAAVAYLQGQ